MTRIGLDDAREKLRWAKHHFAILKSDIEPFEERRGYSISVNVNADTGEYSFHVFGIEEPSHDWGLLIGDCLHNARSALDYLMIRLIAVVTGQDPRHIEDRVQFPICAAPAQFQSTVGAASKYPALDGYLTRLKELQPYNNGNPSIWGAQRLPVGSDDTYPLRNFSPVPIALDRLAELDNIDKHRAIHAAWNRCNWIRNDNPGPPRDFTLLGTETTDQPLTDGTKLDAWRFATPLPRAWIPTEMEMKRAFPLHVAFELLAGGEESALQTLRLCIWGAEVVLDLFEPVFAEHLQPPFPVTAAPMLEQGALGTPLGWPATFLDGYP